MQQYIRITVDGENVSDCSCFALGATLGFQINYREVTWSCGSAGSANLTVTNITDGTVYYNNTQSVANATASPDITYGSFDAVTPGVYDILYTFTVCGVDTVYHTQLTVCPAGEVEYVSCGVYKFTNNYDNGVLVSIKLPDGTIVTDNVQVDAGDSYTFTLPEGGIYIVDYLLAYTTDDDVVVTVHYYIQVNFFCAFEVCLTSLITQVLCQTELDPCCNLCNEEEKEKVEMLRFELNKLLALYGYYLGLNFYQRIKYFGVFEMTEDVRTGLIELNDVVTKIIAITKQCGILPCQEDQLKSIGCGC